ncbi:hypothetical protein E2C01_087218 [Portunus trituberculatus]|uniref:Uncharacterized protein n=1 Tax=Portunus trituberculatus TaxID=210409 RepID=A0A5B7JDH3_PORTR|nr:hypothetical protein [Portunus trituberculatus]
MRDEQQTDLSPSCDEEVGVCCLWDLNSKTNIPPRIFRETTAIYPLLSQLREGRVTLGVGSVSGWTVG